MKYDVKEDWMFFECDEDVDDKKDLVELIEKTESAEKMKDKRNKTLGIKSELE